MEQCLLQKRLPLKAASSEDLALIWQLYIKKDNHLRALRREIEGLRAKQEAEIHTIVEYVENLERKKEMLFNKLDAEKIMQEAQRNEIEDMLLQKNLAEIISCSPSEQVAYLLAERSSRLEKLHGLDGINVKEGSQSGEENASKERDQQQLERDAAEAASTLDEAHQEIRQLRNELESFCLTLGACGGHLDRDMPQLRKGTDANKALKAEISQLRDTVHRMKRCFYTPWTEDLDSEEDEVIKASTHKLINGSLSKVKRRKKAKDIHKRCSEELKEKICALQDLKQIILQLDRELERETMQRKKAEEECEKQRESREEAEELTMQLLELQEQKDSDYEAQVQYFQEQLQSLKTELDWVKSALQTPAPAPQHEEPKIQSQEVQLLNKEQQSTWDLLGNSREQLLNVIERNSQFQHRIGFLEQENQKVVAELAESLAKVNHLEENEASLNKRMKHLEEREEELQSLLAKEELSQQVYDLQNKEMIKLRQAIENLNERLTISEQDYKKLHPKLQQADLNLSLQIRKYNDRKAHHKNKIARTKELYLRETGWRDEKIQEQEKQLGILTKRLERIQAENEALLLNKQELLHQLNKAEEARLHPVATVTSMQQRLDLPETDNVQKRGANILKSTKIKNLLKKLRNS